MAIIPVVALAVSMTMAQQTDSLRDAIATRIAASPGAVVGLSFEDLQTGEKVSIVMEINEPTTEDGLFYNFQCYHPSAKRDTFKIDLENKIDPTLRTHLE